MRRVLIPALALLLVACGGGDDSDPTPTTQSEATEPVATATTVPSVGITFLMVAGAEPGGRASVTIRTDPVGVECDIAYTTPNGTPSDAQGLEPATTRGSGTVSWEWTISAATEPGTGRVTVTCDDASAMEEIEIG